MRKRMFIGVFVFGIFLGSLPVLGEVSNPIDCQFTCGLSGRYQFPSGFMQISFDPQDVLYVPLNGTLSPGEYDLYVCVGQDNDQSKPDRLVEIALGETILPLVYSNSSVRWIGPLRYRVAWPVDTIDLHGSSTVLIDAFWIVPAGKKFEGDPAGAVANGPMPKDWRTVWLDWPDVYKKPMWVTPEMPVEIRVRGASAPDAKGDASIICHFLDYDHNPVGKYEFTFPLTGSDTAQKMETIPVPKRFGPYLLRCMVKLPDGQEAEFQRIVMRVSPPLEFVSDRLGGHGNLPLLRRMGVKWNRKWDSGGRELHWMSVQPNENEPFRLNYTPAPEPIRELVVLEVMPDWINEGTAYSQWRNSWLKYVRAVVEHYRGQFPAYEIRNEHYNDPSNEEYVQKHYELVCDTAKVIHETDPKAIVTSGGPPPDYGWSYKWWGVFGPKGLFRPLDAVSAHLYFGAGGTRPLDQDIACDAFVQRLRKILDANGAKGKQLWDTESGLCPMESFYLGRQVTYGSWGHQGFTPRQPVPYQTGAAMAGRFLLLHFWYDIRWFYYHTDSSYGNSWALCDMDGTPLPAAGVMAQLTRLMDQAKAAGRPKLPEGFWGYRFKNGPETVTAFWAVELKPGEKRFIPFPKGVKVLDLFCNPVEPSEQLEVGISPILLIGSSEAVDAAVRKFVVTSKIEEIPGKLKMANCLTSPDSPVKAIVKADSTAEGSSLDRVRDGKTDDPNEAWTSSADGGEHWIEYEWPKEQTINRIVCAWPAGNLPEGRVVQWHDGLKWQPIGGPSAAKQPVEDEMISPVTTKRLRLLIHPARGKPAKVTEFAAYFVPRLTPPLTEMQEIWTRDFKPNAEGFICDWLICGPFPSPGDRFATHNQVTGWNTDFLAEGEAKGETSIQPRVEQEHTAKFPAGTRAPWKPMDVRVAWQPVHTGEESYLDLAKAFTNDMLSDSKIIVEQCIGYAACYIDLPEDLDGTLAVGSDDGYRIWIDDKVMAELIVFRGPDTDQEKYPLRLTKGKHRLLIKIHNDLGGHGIYLRLLDREGKPVMGYTVKLIP